MDMRHLALAADWEAAVAEGSYRVSTRGVSLDEQGFIHCSFPEHVADVAARFYADVTEPLVVLVIDGEEVEAGGVAVLVDEVDGVGYPHVYGPLYPECVTEVLPARMDNGALVIEQA